MRNNSIDVSNYSKLSESLSDCFSEKVIQVDDRKLGLSFKLEENLIYVRVRIIVSQSKPLKFTEGRSFSKYISHIFIFKAFK